MRNVIPMNYKSRAASLPSAMIDWGEGFWYNISVAEQVCWGGRQTLKTPTFSFSFSFLCLPSFSFQSSPFFIVYRVPVSRPVLLSVIACPLNQLAVLPSAHIFFWGVGWNVAKTEANYWGHQLPTSIGKRPSKSGLRLLQRKWINFFLLKGFIADQYLHSVDWMKNVFEILGLCQLDRELRMEILHHPVSRQPGNDIEFDANAMVD